MAITCSEVDMAKIAEPTKTLVGAIQQTSTQFAEVLRKRVFRDDEIRTAPSDSMRHVICS